MAEEQLRNYIGNIREWLMKLSEDRTLPMDVRVQAELRNQIQSIDHDIFGK